MELIASGVDSISIQLINLQQTQVSPFYSSNNLMFFKSELDNENIIQSRYTTKSDTRTNLFYTSHCGNRYNPNTYTTFNFSGLKSYKNKKDACRANILHDFLKFLPNIAIEKRLSKLDLYFDMAVDKEYLDYFLPIKTGQGTAVNNSFNYFNTTLYIKDKNISKPSQRAYLYIKSIKEHLDEYIIRFEISIRNLNKIENNYEAVLNHINKILSTYKLYHFNSKAKCNIIKRAYNKNISKSKKENFPAALENRTKALGGQEIQLSISDETKALIKMFFKKSEKKIKPERKIPTYIKNLPRKKRTKSTALKKKISIYHIPKPKMHKNISSTKNSVLLLTNKINSISVNPLILKVFHYQNKAPPIKVLYLSLWLKYHYH